MSRYLPVNPSVDDIARVIKDLQRSVDGLVAGKLTVNRDLDMRGYRIVNMGQPIDKSDGQTKIGDDGQQFAPLNASYVVAGTLASNLPNERLLSGSAEILVTDNGPGATVSISLDPTWVNDNVGNVDGPATSTDNAIARWDGITGDLLQDSITLLSDTGAFSNVLSLENVTGGFVGIDPWVIATGYIIGDEVVAQNYLGLDRAFRCIANHTSSTANWPGAGRDWRDYWEYFYEPIIVYGGIDSTDDIFLNRSQINDVSGVVFVPRNTSADFIRISCPAAASIVDSQHYILPLEDGTAGQVLQTAGNVGGSSQLSWVTPGSGSGVGTVTSVDGSGGTTGLTFSGGPITGSGTLTLGGTLAVANGGTGANLGAMTPLNLVRMNASGTALEDAGSATGPTGATGAGYAATSTTSLSLTSSSSRTFTTQSGLAYSAGARIRAASAANPTTAYMEGVVTSYSGTSLVATMDSSLGSGTYSDWTINLAGEQPQGYVASSSSTFDLQIGTLNFVVSSGLAYRSGARVRVSSTSFPTTAYMEGVVTSYSGTTLQVTTDRFIGSGTFSSWRISLVGDVGDTGPTGATGANGTDGQRGGVRFTFSTTTSAGTSGDGQLRYNNGTIGSVTQIYVGVTDANAVNVKAAMQTWDDSTSSVKGQLYILGAAPSSAVVNVFNITGSITDNTTYLTIPVAYLSGTLPSDTTALAVEFARTGDAGALTGTLTSGRVPYANGATSLTDSANLLFNGTHLSLAGNSSIYFNGALTGYRLYQGVNGLTFGHAVFGDQMNMIIGALAPSTDGVMDLGTSALGWESLYLGDGGGDTARIVPPALSGDITLTLPAATGTLATLAGTENFSNKSLESSVKAQSGSSSTYGRPLVCVHDQAGNNGNNAGGGDTDAMSHSLAASSVQANGGRLHISAVFQLNDDGGNNQRFRIIVGSATVFDSGSASTHDAAGPYHWVDVTIMRDTTVTGYAVARWFKQDGGVVAQVSAPSITWGNANTVKGVVNGVTAAVTRQIAMTIDTIQE